MKYLLLLLLTACLTDTEPKKVESVIPVKENYLVEYAIDGGGFYNALYCSEDEALGVDFFITSDWTYRFYALPGDTLCFSAERLTRIDSTFLIKLFVDYVEVLSRSGKDVVEFWFVLDDGLI